MPQHERLPIAGAGAVVIRDDALLLVRRAGGAYEGCWAVPGGRQRFGERLEETARRETLEETGIEIEVGRVVWVGDAIDASADPQWHYTIVDFEGTPIGGRLQAGDDATEAAWIPLDRVRELALTPTMPSLLDKLAL